MITLTPDEYFSELGILHREFPELSKAAIVEMLILIHEEIEDED